MDFIGSWLEDSRHLEYVGGSIASLPDVYALLFEAVNFFTVCTDIRSCVDAKKGYTHPFAIFVACMFSAFSGKYIICILTGVPPLVALGNDSMVALSIIFYFMIFHCPGDLIYRLSSKLPISLPVTVVSEIFRAYKLLLGYREGLRAFGDRKTILLFTTAFRGNVNGWTRPIKMHILGSEAPHEFESPSLTAKSVIFCSILLNLSPSSNVIYIFNFCFFLFLKLSIIFGRPVDPFKVLSLSTDKTYKKD